jgi:AbrB family looped-hinge helix DNA binding protein
MRKNSQTEVDEYGRVWIPEEIRKEVGIHPSDFVFIEVLENGEVAIQKCPAPAAPEDMSELNVHCEMEFITTVAEEESYKRLYAAETNGGK